ncbi:MULTISPECIES: hypothetical protein [Thermus]|uniref:Uncharacterized protein n=1 Tax=Thermus brockianus TaxID=56956 RepID=A0ABN6NMX0_THEBO|nr:MULTISPECIES: hypothetical protein [Thermus]BDG17787.1 hypothetical protein TbrSNM41_25210 [Thermus brockianus]
MRRILALLLLALLAAAALPAAQAQDPGLVQPLSDEVKGLGPGRK